MIHTNLKLGKLPAKEDPKLFGFAAYLDLAKLPKPPATFGHQAQIPASDWGMLGNDQYGDCVFAGAGHEGILAGTVGGHPTQFSDHGVLADYAAVTGFDPLDPDTDRGTDMKVAAKYRRQTGVIDKVGTRHKVTAYLGITPDDLDALAASTYLLTATGLGIRFPGSAMDQFNAEKPWDVVKGATIEGGHYVPVVGRNADGNFVVVTWGRLQLVTARFIQKYADETLAYLNPATLNKLGKTPEGFNEKQLQADLAALK